MTWHEHETAGSTGRSLASVIRGWLGYHAVPDSYGRLDEFVTEVTKLWLHQHRYLPVTSWTAKEVVEEACLWNMVDSIPVSQVQRILRNVQLQPHENKIWRFTTEKNQELLQQQAAEANGVAQDDSRDF